MCPADPTAQGAGDHAAVRVARLSAVEAGNEVLALLADGRNISGISFKVSGSDHSQRNGKIFDFQRRRGFRF